VAEISLRVHTETLNVSLITIPQVDDLGLVGVKEAVVDDGHGAGPTFLEIVSEDAVMPESVT
jgi:hypothetical protein